MSPFSAPVLGGAAIVASPALWQSLVDGTLPLEVAMTRYLLAVVVSWAAISLVASLAFPSTPAHRAATAAAKRPLGVLAVFRTHAQDRFARTQEAAEDVDREHALQARRRDGFDARAAGNSVHRSAAAQIALRAPRLVLQPLVPGIVRARIVAG